MGDYPRPWHVEQRQGWWWVIDANDGIVAGPFGAASAAWAWIERATGGDDL